MRIGFLINEIDGKGGIQKNYRLWHNIFLEKGDESFLFVLKKPSLSKINDKNIIYLNSENKLLQGIELNKKIKEIGNFDLFIVNTEYMKKFLPKSLNYYISVHNTWSNSIFKRKGLKRYFRYKKIKKKYKNEKLIGISKSVLNDITDTLKIPVKSKKVIYAPHHIEKVIDLANEIEVKDNYIVAVGSLINRKNYKLLIKAYSKLNTSLKLFIIGIGNEEKNLKQFVKSLNLEKKVKFLGFKENPYPYIKNAKLLVSSSISEGLPRVLVESLILNTPIVSTLSSQGVYEVMTDELKQFISNIDENDLSKKIQLALTHYPKITSKYYEKFDINNSYKKFLTLL